MKRTVTVMCALAMLLALFGCDGKKVVKPIVLNGYIVVNNTIGFVRPIAENPDAVVENIDLLVRGGEAVVGALKLIVKYYDKPYVQQVLTSSESVLEALKAIQADPSQVTDKITVVLTKLEEVRGGFVTIDEKLELGLEFPTPRVVVEKDELTTSITTLEEQTKAAN